MEGDSRYYSRRAFEERALATQAAHPQVRHAHLTMADRYEQLAQATADQSEQLMLRQQAAG
jgi:hypothetical protein